MPFTFTAHGYDIHRKPPADLAARALAASTVVTVSAANARHICEQFQVPKAHLRIIPCGVDTEMFSPRSGRPGQEDLPWIVCVARHVKVKNLGLLLEACAELRHRGTGFRCALIGDGPELSKLRRLAGPNVQVLGWQPKFKSIEPIVATAWRWHQQRPDGYAD